MDFSFPEYHYDENLKEVPDSLEAFEEFIEKTKNSEGKSRELLTYRGLPIVLLTNWNLRKSV